MRDASAKFAPLALLVVFGVLIAVALWGAVRSFSTFGGDLGLHGWLALIGGSVLTIALTAGLMWLVFYSARKGYDDAAAPWDRPRPDDPPD